jgi:hypothetical protein
MFSKKCRAHYKMVKMTPIEHFVLAWSLIGAMAWCMIAMIGHSLAPGYTSRLNTKRLKELVTRL